MVRDHVGCSRRSSNKKMWAGHVDEQAIRGRVHLHKTGGVRF